MKTKVHARKTSGRIPDTYITERNEAGIEYSIHFDDTDTIEVILEAVHVALGTFEKFNARPAEYTEAELKDMMNRDATKKKKYKKTSGGMLRFREIQAELASLLGEQWEILKKNPEVEAELREELK